MIAVAVGPDDEPGVSPEEVDSIATNARVDLGGRQSMAMAERQELELEAARGSVRDECSGIDRELVDLRLADCVANKPGSTIARMSARVRWGWVTGMLSLPVVAPWRVEER